MTAATTLVGGDGEGSEGRTAGGKLTEWKGLKGSKAGVRREEKRREEGCSSEEGRRVTERETAEE